MCISEVIMIRFIKFSTGYWLTVWSICLDTDYMSMNLNFYLKFPVAFSLPSEWISQLKCSSETCMTFEMPMHPLLFFLPVSLHSLILEICNALNWQWAKVSSRQDLSSAPSSVLLSRNGSGTLLVWLGNVFHCKVLLRLLIFVDTIKDKTI